MGTCTLLIKEQWYVSQEIMILFRRVLHGSLMCRETLSIQWLKKLNPYGLVACAPSENVLLFGKKIYHVMGNSQIWTLPGSRHLIGKAKIIISTLRPVEKYEVKYGSKIDRV